MASFLALLLRGLVCTSSLTTVFGIQFDDIYEVIGPNSPSPKYGVCDAGQASEIEGYYQDLVDLVDAGLRLFADFRVRASTETDRGAAIRQEIALETIVAFFGIYPGNSNPNDGIGAYDTGLNGAENARIAYVEDVLQRTSDLLTNGPSGSDPKVTVHCGDDWLLIFGPEDDYVDPATGQHYPDPHGVPYTFEDFPSLRPRFYDRNIQGQEVRNQNWAIYTLPIPSRFVIEADPDVDPDSEGPEERTFCDDGDEGFSFSDWRAITLCQYLFDGANQANLFRGSIPQPGQGYNTLAYRYSRSSVFLHETIHQILGPDNNRVGVEEIYGASNCLTHARSDRDRVLGNPESWMYFCVAAFSSEQARNYNGQYVSYATGTGVLLT
ncbi:hypothetical protein TWF694_005143 [Orbilia ellipsospora]|uniref:Lysine-specific metallo-endopeptidase domain-containing protein n=1 Tax=Orbilia ellipsospora TaxID=2528407 RepID=A0AAV9WVZ8_9PEZI